MADLLENPLGLYGFEFVEFSSPAPDLIERSFEALGFARIARHRGKNAALYRQGDINFIVNGEPDSVDACFASTGGPSVSGLALRVRHPNEAFSHALDLGAAPMDAEAALVGSQVPRLQGIGGIPLYLVDQAGGTGALYDGFEFAPGSERPHAGCGLQAIDHLAYDVYGGCLSYWAQLYARLFGSRALRCLDIRDSLAARARSRAEGIRHIALRSGEPFSSVEGLNGADVPLLVLPRCGPRIQASERA
jgi:4-hydroxyphenylpyruvate dioxygenase